MYTTFNLQGGSLRQSLRRFFARQRLRADAAAGATWAETRGFPSTHHYSGAHTLLEQYKRYSNLGQVPGH